MYGGIEDTGGQKVTPCGDVWALKVSPSKSKFPLAFYLARNFQGGFF